MRQLIIKCDCCGVEIGEQDVCDLTHYIHVSPDYNRMQGHSKIVSGRMHCYSQRQEKKEFCLPCYNNLLYGLFDRVKEMRSNWQKEQPKP